MPLPVGGKAQRGGNVVPIQYRKIFQDFLRRHARRQIFQYVLNRDAQAANAWLTAPLAQFDGENVAVMHEVALWPEILSLLYIHPDTSLNQPQTVIGFEYKWDPQLLAL